MKKLITSIAVSGAVVTGGVAGALLGVPTLSGAQTDEAPASEDGAPDKRGPIKEVLDGLVADGTLTQDQADKVGEALREKLGERKGRHGPRGHKLLAGAAEALGLTGEELRTELREGKSLATIAEEQGVSVDDLVAAMVAAAEARIDEAVEAGKLDQAKADELKSGLEDKIRSMVDRTPPARDGKRFRGGPGPITDDAPPAEPTAA